MLFANSSPVAECDPKPNIELTRDQHRGHDLLLVHGSVLVLTEYFLVHPQMVASPKGNLLALAGTGGLQVFHFNGGNPITPYAGLLATHGIEQIRWDTHDHLYGISMSCGRLYAFKITPTGHKQAAGSPYSVKPLAITVLSK
jgi:hypothetical protein